MNKYYRVIPKRLIVVSVCLSEFSTSDLENIVKANRNCAYILDKFERNKTFTLTYTKRRIIEILGDTEDKLKRLKMLFRECDANWETVCTELYLSEGRYLELGIGNTQTMHLDGWDFSNILYKLVVNVLSVNGVKRVKKRSMLL